MIKRNVQCNQRKVCQSAAWCRHAKPHKQCLVLVQVDPEKVIKLCTQVHDCDDGKVRCR
jgi:hypothetical protein